jgi:hypothetical protein
MSGYNFIRMKLYRNHLALMLQFSADLFDDRQGVNVRIMQV